MDCEARTGDRGFQARNRGAGVVDRGIVPGDRGARVVSRRFGVFSCPGLPRNGHPAPDDRRCQLVARYGQHGQYDGLVDARRNRKGGRVGFATWVVVLDPEGGGHGVARSATLDLRDRFVRSSPGHVRRRGSFVAGVVGHVAGLRRHVPRVSGAQHSTPHPWGHESVGSRTAGVTVVTCAEAGPRARSRRHPRTRERTAPRRVHGG
jgi:hypothetical protein